MMPTSDPPADPNPTTNQAEIENPQNELQGSLGPRSLFFLACWAGLTAGFIELGLLILLRDPTGNLRPMFGKSRHYLWLIPTVNLGLVLLGFLPLLLGPLRLWAAGRQIALVLIGSVLILPALLLAFPSIYAVALLILAVGIARIAVWRIQRHHRIVRQLVRLTTPVMLLATVGLGFFTFSRIGVRGPNVPGGDSGTPNVLLIVLDTVRADHLSLHGYGRETTPALDAFASRGLHFTKARSTAPWTLTSHASLMTGRWPRDLSARHYVPLDRAAPTLAEVFSAQGYETVGMVANTTYCSFASGLDRGFHHYEDIPLNPITAVTTTELGTHLLSNYDLIVKLLNPEERRRPTQNVEITAASLSDRFLDWLDSQRDTEQPFFAFLNYFDAHDPYIVPDGEEHAFPPAPEVVEDRRLLYDWWFWGNKPKLSPRQLAMAIASYDSCIAYLDRHLGRLLDSMEQQGLLENTIVVITADHGESFGEHQLFGHGGSVFEPELHVPLVIVGPGISPGTVDERPVNLRNLTATITELADLDNSPFQGPSLVQETETGVEDARRSSSDLLAEVFEPSEFPPNLGLSPVFGGPLSALYDADQFKYIYHNTRQGGLEELYALKSDPNEQTNLARLPSFADRIGQFRTQLKRIVVEDADPTQGSAHRAWP